MGIKTFPHPPYSSGLAPCDFWLFPKLRGCRYGTIEEMKEARGLPWGLEEVVGTVQQVHCRWRRLLRRGLEFHVCTINKSAHTEKIWKLIVCSSYYDIGRFFLQTKRIFLVFSFFMDFFSWISICVFVYSQIESFVVVFFTLQELNSGINLK